MNTPEHSTLYKLIVLYILKQTSTELTRSQISDLILTKGYTDFITLQLAFSELEEAGLITTHQINNRTLLSMTEEGLHTISCLQDRIAYPIRRDINMYLKSNRYNLQKELSIQSRCYAVNGKNYEAQLIAKDQQEEIINIKLRLPSEELAETVCNNWEKKNTSVYEYLIHELL